MKYLNRYLQVSLTVVVGGAAPALLPLFGIPFPWKVALIIPGCFLVIDIGLRIVRGVLRRENDDQT